MILALYIGFRLLAILFAISLIYFLIKRIRLVLSYKKAVTYGKRVDGTIIKKIVVERRGLPSYHFLIKYNDINSDEEKTLLTPDLKYFVYDVLGSDKCGVFYYHNMIIAGDYKSYKDMKNTAPIHIFTETSDYTKYANLFYKVILILALIITVALFIFAIITSFQTTF